MTGALAVHASSAPGLKEGERMRFALTFALISGRPRTIRKRLPDREIDLYPIRGFTVILHPRRDLVVRGRPEIRESTSSRVLTGRDGYVFRLICHEWDDRASRIPATASAGPRMANGCS